MEPRPFDSYYDELLDIDSPSRETAQNREDAEDFRRASALFHASADVMTSCPVVNWKKTKPYLLGITDSQIALFYRWFVQREEILAAIERRGANASDVPQWVRNEIFATIANIHGLELNFPAATFPGGASAGGVEPLQGASMGGASAAGAS